MALKQLISQLTRRQCITIGKGVLCYTLVFVLVFLRRFNSLVGFPVALTSMVIVSVSGLPGLSVGACLSNALFGLLGVGVGAFWFYVLSNITSRVGQGFVFFCVLYVLALIKAQSPRYFSFSLLAVLLSFNGIYTSLLLGGPGNFSAVYLESYVQAYCWGFVLVLGVNILILPVSSERELRELLVLSLEHISTFTHLIAKTYSMEITDDERVLRDQLNQSIRADFGLLQVKTAHAGLEVNWTRWSMGDYSEMVAKIKQMQQGLITSYSSLMVMGNSESTGLRIIKRGLEETATGKAFRKLRLGFDLLISDIVKELAVGKQEYHSPAPGASWDDFLDFEDEQDLEAGRHRPRAPSVSPSSPQIRDQLALVTARLRTEVQGADNSTMASRRGSFSGEKPRCGEGTTTVPSLADPSPKRVKDLESLDRVAFLRGCWDHFKSEQHKATTRLLAADYLGDEELRLHKPSLSPFEQFVSPPAESSHSQSLGERITSHFVTSSPFATAASRRPDDAEEGVQAETGSSDDFGNDVGRSTPKARSDSVEEEVLEAICCASVLRAFSFIFGMGGVIDNLASLHDHVVPRDEAHRPSKRLHFHLFETIPKAAKAAGIPLRQALATLSGRSFVDKKVSWWVRIARLERMARTPTSIYAFKTACAVSVYAVFLLAPSLTNFFVTYGLTGGLITIVVAMAPTLGQTVLTFVLQLLGTGFGTLYGLLILRIFLDVGGFHFNPFGMVCLIAMYAVPLMYIIYLRPMYYAGALLAMNGTGTLVITEWVYTSVPGQIRPDFDSAALRAGKAFTALAIAVAIAAIFQICILRNPARRTLRLKLSNITFSLGSYSSLLSFMIEAQAPIEATCNPHRLPPDPAAMESVRAELIRREGQLQGELLALMPLLRFAAAEPAFGQPFQGAVVARLIRSHQLVLDRLREARTAIGVQGFNSNIRKNFTSHLAPYRDQNKRYNRAFFYLISTSLATKEPLPHQLPTMIATARSSLQHDALVLSSRLYKSEEGRDVLHSQEFVRYWFYLTAYSGVSYNLEAMQTDLRLLLGEPDDSPFAIQERD